MADTKKEHYVPRCYLENFEGSNGRINVYDKVLMQIRNQRKEEIAAENYFYDIDFDKMTSRLDVGKYQSVKEDIKKIVGIDDWETIKSTVLDPKHIEKKFLCKVEGEYSKLLKNIISKSYNGNDWVMKHCYAFSQEEKIHLALFIAIQTIRTRTYRDIIKQTIEKGYETLIYKQLNKGNDTVPKDSFSIKVSDDFIKLQHAQLLLDEELAVDFSETLLEHIWVMYVNKTELPFYTSDNPVLTIPHKKDEYRSYSGFASEGIEIAFPITPHLLIAMYDKNSYSEFYTDRSFIELNNTKMIEYYNQVQVMRSFRCIYSSTDNFELAKKLCDEFPQICDSSNLVTVS